MRGPVNDSTEAIGSDSFLDVVTNIVGILIILVMVVGMRARNAPIEGSSDQDVRETPLLAEIDALDKQATGVQRDIFHLAAHARAVKRERVIAEANREGVALMVATAEKELSGRKAKLDAARQEQFEAETNLARTKSQLEQIERDIALTKAARQPAVEVKAFFTPISKTVNGKEIHFQLAEGHVAYVPIEELFVLAREETRSHMTRISELSDRVMTVGPTQGFEMRYTVDVAVSPREGQMSIRSREWQAIPVQQRLGETVQEALGHDSHFRRLLSRGTPADTTVTLWTYPDSFAEYRALAEELQRLGYATAGRPLPKGFPIGGSPQGSKSAAQ